MIIFLFVVLAFVSVFGDLVERPVSTIAEVGSDVVFKCSTDLEYVVKWERKIPGNPTYVDIYHGTGVVTEDHKDRFFVNPKNDEKSYDLKIKNVTLEDAGVYECVDDSGFGRPRGQFKFVNLTVYESTLSCTDDIKISGWIYSDQCINHLPHISTLCRIGCRGADCQYVTMNWYINGVTSPGSITRNDTHVTAVLATPLSQDINQSVIRCFVGPSTAAKPLEWTSTSIKLKHISPRVQQVSGSVDVMCTEENYADDCRFTWTRADGQIVTHTNRLQMSDTSTDTNNYTCSISCTYTQHKTCNMTVLTVTTLPPASGLTVGLIIFLILVVIALIILVIVLVYRKRNTLTKLCGRSCRAKIRNYAGIENRELIDSEASRPPTRASEARVTGKVSPDDTAKALLQPTNDLNQASPNSKDNVNADKLNTVSSVNASIESMPPQDTQQDKALDLRVIKSPETDKPTGDEVNPGEANLQPASSDNKSNKLPTQRVTRQTSHSASKDVDGTNNENRPVKPDKRQPETVKTSERQDQAAVKVRDSGMFGSEKTLDHEEDELPPGEGDKPSETLNTQDNSPDKPLMHFYTGNDIVSVAHWKQNLYVLCKNNNNISAYSDVSPYSYKESHDIMLSDLKEAVDMISCSVNNCLYVLDVRARCVYKIGSDRQISLFSIPKDKIARLLSLDDVGNIVLANSSGIYKFSSEGKAISMLNVPIKCSPLHQAVQLANGKYVVSNKKVLGFNIYLLNDHCELVSECPDIIKSKSVHMSVSGSVVMLSCDYGVMMLSCNDNKMKMKSFSDDIKQVLRCVKIEGDRCVIGADTGAYVLKIYFIQDSGKPAVTTSVDADKDPVTSTVEADIRTLITKPGSVGLTNADIEIIKKHVQVVGLERVLDELITQVLQEKQKENKNKSDSSTNATHRVLAAKLCSALITNGDKNNVKCLKGVFKKKFPLSGFSIIRERDISSMITSLWFLEDVVLVLKLQRSEVVGEVMNIYEEIVELCINTHEQPNDYKCATAVRESVESLVHVWKKSGSVTELNNLRKLFEKAENDKKITGNIKLIYMRLAALIFHLQPSA